MSDERISVAELLARSGSASSNGGGRRRHRGGDEKSISVAELTGEIPVIRDESARPGQTGESSEPASPAPVEVAPVNQGAPQAPQVPEVDAAEVVDDDETIVEADIAEPVVSTPDAEPEPEASGALAAAVADTGRFTALDVSNVDDRPMGGGLDGPSAPRADYERRPDRAPSSQPDSTSSTHAWSQWTESSAPASRRDPAPSIPQAMATSDFHTAQVQERQARFAEPVEAATPAPDTTSMNLQQITDATESDRVEPVSTGSSGYLRRPIADAPIATDTPAATAAAPRTETADSLEPADGATADAADRDGSPRGGWARLLGEIVLAFVAGAALFYGFYLLWNWGGGTWTIALAVVLAFIVVIAIVTFTHFLRKTTDLFTLGLALLVGLVVTFGPLIMSLVQD